MGDRRFIHKNNVNDAIRLLNIVINTLNDNNIKYYLDFGTLLGAMRENSFIRWDTNLNLSIYDRNGYDKIEEVLEEIYKCHTRISRFKNVSFLEESKFFVRKWTRNKRKRKKMVPLNKFQNYFKNGQFRIATIENENRNVLMEIFFKYEEEDSLRWAAYGKVKQIPIDLLENGLKEIEFYGINCSVPINYDAYLTYIYEDWKTPNKEWSQEDGYSMLKEYRRRQSGDRRFSNSKNKEAMIKLIGITVEALEKHNIKYYLDFGTLLGAMREDSLMDWDDDVDISLINEDDFSKIPMVLDEINRKYGYETNLYTIKDTQKEYALSRKKYVEPRNIEFTDVNNYHIAKIRNQRIYDPHEANIILDLFFQYKSNEKIHWFMFGKVYHVSSNLLDAGFKQIDFHGISCTVPVNYDNYLTAIFGDWRTPKLDWVEDDSPAMQDDYRGQVPEDRRFMHKKNADAAIELLKIVSEVMDKYDIKFYLDFGTLLGAVRDDGLMPWDDDIDISIIDEKDFFKLPKVMAEIKKQYGYSTNTYTFRDSQEEYESHEEMYVKPKRLEFTDVDNYQVGIIKTNKQWIPGIGNVIMDIFCKYEYEEYSYCMMFGKEYKIPSLPLSKGFEKIDFHGVECFIPVAYDEYLTNVFADWRTPKLDWVEDDCPALVDK